MSYKGRITFTVAGYHPLLYVLRDHLIHQGFGLVPMDGDVFPAFVLYGAEIEKPDEYEFVLRALSIWAPIILRNKIPVMLLSSSKVYSDRNRDMTSATKAASAEHHANLVTSSLEPAAGTAILSMLTEWVFTRQVRTMVLRIFNVYGPDIKHGVVNKWLEAARRGEALGIHGNGYQTRTYLYQDDLFSCFDRLIKRFCNGSSGTYNIGHDQEISLKRLADSIWQLTHGPDVAILAVSSKTEGYHAQWKLPDLTRVKAFASWKPRTSIRSGLFLMTDPYK